MDTVAGGERRTTVGSGGRRLDRSRDVAILRAAIEGLAEVGYDRLTMDDVAARAHAGKGAIYRRWPSKAALVVDAVMAWREEMGTVAVPDTGSLAGDIDAVVAAVPAAGDADREQLSVIAAVLTAASRDPELGAAVSEHVLERPRQGVRELLDRAVRRGEIPPDRDLDLLPDLLVGLSLTRLVTGRVPDREFVRRVFDQVVLPLATGRFSARQVRP